MNLTFKQVVWWHSNIYPLFNKDKSFDNWISYSSSKVISNKIYGTPHNLSDITFSIIEKDGVINPSRFYIGFFNPSRRDLKIFSNTLKNFTGKDDTLNLINDPSLIGFGIGIDDIAREKRIYIAKNNNPLVIGLTYSWNGDLIEFKKYVKNNGVVTVFGERGSRTQTDLHLRGKDAKVFVEKLPVTSTFKTFAYKVLNSGLFNLDTISTSSGRGTALYFD